MNLWDIFHLILFAGALQGVVLGVSLWQSKSSRKTANRFLAAILFFFAYRLLAEVLRSINVIGFDSWTYHVFLEYNWIYGALIFFYIRSYIVPDAAFFRRDWLHFLPVILEFILSNYVKIQNFYWDGTRESLSWLGTQAYVLWMHTPFQQVVFAGLILYYVYRSRLLLRQYTAANTRPVQQEEVRWVRLLLGLYAGFSILVMVVGTVDYLFFDFAFDPFYKFPVYTGMAILTYWLGLQGFARRDTPYLQASVPAEKKPVPIEPQSEAVAALTRAMEVDQLFKNQKLSLADLAEAVDLKPHQLTQVLNRQLQQSFSDYVNGYRVREAVRLINSPDFEKYTLLSLAYESGFNSKASFNRVVKKITGKSPRELRENS